MVSNAPIPFAEMPFTAATCSIPYDVLCNIVERADFDTLKTLSLVSRDCKFEANKHLWNTFTMSVAKITSKPNEDEHTARARVEEACDVLLCPERALHIRHLYVGLYTSLGSDNDPELQRTVQKLLTALRGARHLLTLEIRIFYYNSLDLIQSLSNCDFAPDLSSLTVECYGPQMTGLEPFWESHSKIRSLEWVAGELDLDSASHRLPLLDRVRVRSARQAALVRGRPVTSVTVSRLAESETNLLLEHLRESTTPITHLSVSVIDRVPSAALYSDIVAHLPDLRALEVVHRRMPDDQDAIALGILSSLNNLESFHFDSPACAKNDAFFDGCLTQCASLRKASRRSAGQSRALRRVGNAGSWEEVTMLDKGQVA